MRSLFAGAPRDLAFAGFLDAFHAEVAEARWAMIAAAPALNGDAAGAAIQDYLASTSPAEFRHRTIVTAADPLTRARTDAGREAVGGGDPARASR